MLGTGYSRRHYVRRLPHHHRRKWAGRVRTTLREVAPECLGPNDPQHRAGKQDHERVFRQLAPRRYPGELSHDELELGARRALRRVGAMKEAPVFVWHSSGMPEDGLSNVRLSGASYWRSVKTC